MCKADRDISLPGKLVQLSAYPQSSYAGAMDKTFGSMHELMEFFKTSGAKGGRVAAKKLTKAQRTARAKKAAAASAEVRSKNARKKRRGGSQ